MGFYITNLRLAVITFATNEITNALFQVILNKSKIKPNSTITTRSSIKKKYPVRL